jgi:hypothetical protein
MGTKRVTEDIRKALKRQNVEPDVEDRVQVTSRSPNPTGMTHSEGAGQPGGHGRDHKASRK